MHPNSLLLSRRHRTALRERQIMNKKVVIENFAPIPWTKYFNTRGTSTLDVGLFHYYTLGEIGPVLVLLHGGGHSSLTWGPFAEDIFKKIECRLLAIDLRGHGSTVANDESNLSLENMAADVKGVVENIFSDGIPPLVFIGHSMGGAVAVEVSEMMKEFVIALVVIDVVEGTALDALSVMPSVLRNRPKQFLSIMQAIEWYYRYGGVSNLDAAKVSMPGQLKRMSTGEVASDEICNDNAECAATEDDNSPEHPAKVYKNCTFSSHPPMPTDISAIDEEEGGSEEHEEHPVSEDRNVFQAPGAYTWRVDLAKTECHWPGWFKGLSQKFLNVRPPKLLLMATIQHLDTTLTVGQMQGKFQLHVFPQSGHVIHEDRPEQVAEHISSFLHRQRLVEIKNEYIPAPFH